MTKLYKSLENIVRKYLTKPLAVAGLAGVLGYNPIYLEAQESQTTFRRGHSNSDAKLDLADVIFTLEYLFNRGDPPSCRKAMDSNDDGKVNIDDPLYTLAYLFLGGSAPPSPFKSCGVDPTLDDLTCSLYTPCVPLEGTELEFETIAQGCLYNTALEQIIIIRNQESWGGPFIDFDKEMVIGVVLGLRGNSGYWVNIDKIEYYQQGIKIHYTETNPSVDECATDDVEVDPYHYVRTNNVPGNPVPVANVVFECNPRC